MPTADEILRTAAAIHREEGLDALSLRRVAEAVGVTPMALYHHFDNKDALLDALVAQGFARLEQYFARAAARRTPMTRLRAGVVAYREFALDERRLFELMYLVPRPNVPPAPASLATTPSPSFGALIAAVGEAMEQGRLRRGVPAETILLVWATVHGLITLHFTGRFGGDDARFRAVFDRTINSLLRALRPCRDR